VAEAAMVGAATGGMLLPKMLLLCAYVKVYPMFM
jgi:hypothetical protein